MIWIALAMLAGGLFVYALMSMAKREDRAARRAERELDTSSDVHITRAGSGTGATRGWM